MHRHRPRSALPLAVPWHSLLSAPASTRICCSSPRTCVSPVDWLIILMRTRFTARARSAISAHVAFRCAVHYTYHGLSPRCHLCVCMYDTCVGTKRQCLLPFCYFRRIKMVKPKLVQHGISTENSVTFRTKNKNATELRDTWGPKMTDRVYRTVRRGRRIAARFARCQ